MELKNLFARLYSPLCILECVQVLKSTRNVCVLGEYHFGTGSDGVTRFIFLNKIKNKKRTDLKRATGMLFRFTIKMTCLEGWTRTWGRYLVVFKRDCSLTSKICVRPRPPTFLTSLQQGEWSSGPPHPMGRYAAIEQMEVHPFHSRWVQHRYLYQRLRVAMV